MGLQALFIPPMRPFRPLFPCCIHILGIRRPIPAYKFHLPIFSEYPLAFFHRVVQAGS